MDAKNAEILRNLLQKAAAALQDVTNFTNDQPEGCAWVDDVEMLMVSYRPYKLLDMAERAECYLD
jgi:hypothetical protein